MSDSSSGKQRITSIANGSIWTSGLWCPRKCSANWATNTALFILPLFCPLVMFIRKPHSAHSVPGLFLKFQAGRLFSSEAIMTLLTRQTIIFKSRSMASASELSASKHEQRRRPNSVRETKNQHTSVDGCCRNAKNEFIFVFRLSVVTSDEASICSRGRHGLMSCFVITCYFFSLGWEAWRTKNVLKTDLCESKPD